MNEMRWTDAGFVRAQQVEIDYTNWKGERAKRIIRPVGIAFCINEWHPELQWILSAHDMGKGGAMRSYAMKDIHAWTVLP